MWPTSTAGPVGSAQPCTLTKTRWRAGFRGTRNKDVKPNPDPSPGRRAGATTWLPRPSASWQLAFPLSEQGVCPLGGAEL